MWSALVEARGMVSVARFSCGDLHYNRRSRFQSGTDTAYKQIDGLIHELIDAMEKEGIYVGTTDPV